MLNFCTLFDSNYLSRGLALHESLTKVSQGFHLYVIAFNEECLQFLKKSRIPNLTVISLEEFEDPALLQVKPTRSAAEYCWTCTPSIILFCLKKFNLESCIYVDADMIFYEDPAILLQEMGGQSILITEHRYSPEYDVSATHGTYCVQFMVFKGNEEGFAALNWWREKCLEWCYARLEDGKFGDQKYLDDWTTRFKGVHVLQHRGGGLAPWNVQQFDIYERNGHFSLSEKGNSRTYPLIFYHFHGLKFYADHKVSCCGALYELSAPVKELIYIPYIRKLLNMEKDILKNLAFNPHGAARPSPGRWSTIFQYGKDVLLLMIRGKISPFHFQTYNYSLHHHIYNLNQIQ